MVVDMVVVVIRKVVGRCLPHGSAGDHWLVGNFVVAGQTFGWQQR